MNNAYRNRIAILRGIAAHEMGHAIGLAHADKNDSPAVPTMASCVSSTQAKNQDTSRVTITQRWFNAADQSSA